MAQETYVKKSKINGLKLFALRNFKCRGNFKRRGNFKCREII